MSAISREDLKVILNFGVHIAKVDQDFAVWEKKILARLADAMHLTDEEKAAMAQQEVSLARGLDALSGQDARALLLKTLCAVANSDGVAHEQEVAFITRVVERLGGQAFILSKDEWGTYEPEVLRTFAEVCETEIEL